MMTEYEYLQAEQARLLKRLSVLTSQMSTVAAKSKSSAGKAAKKEKVSSKPHAIHKVLQSMPPTL
jgi:hypothetical protein